MKMKLFLCVLCLAFFADGLLPQTAPVDEATRLAQVEIALEFQNKQLSRMEGTMDRIDGQMDGMLMWVIGLFVGFGIAVYALIHQLRAQLTEMMHTFGTHYADLVLRMSQLQSDLVVQISELRGDVNGVKSDVATVQRNLTKVEGDVTTAQSNIAQVLKDGGDVKINVGGLQKDVAIIQKDVGELNEKVDGIDAHVTEVERSTNAQLTDIRETLAKQQETKSESETPKKETDSSGT